MAGYYRPVIDSNTASTIDANALKGAISSMGSFFGQGQLKTRQKSTGGSGTGEQDPLMSGGSNGGGQPDMEYYTTGGRFWDRINNRQAELANAQLQGQRFGQQLDLFGNQQRLGQQAAYNSGERLGINRDANTNALTNDNFYRNNPQLPQAIAHALQQVVLQGQLAGETAANNNGLTVEAILAQKRQPGLANNLTQANIGHTNQMTRASSELLPYQVAGMQYDNKIKQGEADWINEAQAAKIDNMIAQAEQARAHSKYYTEPKANERYKVVGPGLVLDTVLNQYVAPQPWMNSEYNMLQNTTNQVPVRGVWNLNLPVNSTPLPAGRPIGPYAPGGSNGIPAAVGGGTSPGRVGGAPYGQTISPDKLKQIEAILNSK